jgi:excisionase family DNA binding protein
MVNISVPEKKDLKIWIKEAITEAFKSLPQHLKDDNQHQDEPFFTRKEIATYLKISMVTLHTWMNDGLPYHRKGRRVLFLKSEVLKYVKSK